MLRFSQILTGVCVLLFGLGAGAIDAASERPNVVFIMADDLGIGDVNCYGRDRCQIETPSVDQLAREGMLFSDAHTVSSHCVPVRMSIVTGRYPWRIKGRQPNGPWGYLNLRIPPEHPTVAKMLRAVGYRTGYVGKWHLGTVMTTTDGKIQGLENVDYTAPLKVGPRDYGFDYSFILPGSLDMYPYAFVRNHSFVGKVNKRRGWSAFNRVGPTEENFEDHKVLDEISVEAEQFIARNAEGAKNGDPFFLYFALTSPHTPTSPGKAFQGKSELGVYGDFVMETDDCVGRVMRALEKHGLSENTMVIFTSDHGAALYAGNELKATKDNLRELEKLGHYSSGPHRGYKFSVYEGGLRVPFIVRWPRVVKAGTRCDQLVGLTDLMATLGEITGATLNDSAAPDSFSFMRNLIDPDAAGTRRSIIMQGVTGWVIREGRWKLALCPGSGCDGRFGNKPTRDEAWQAALKQFGRRPNSNDLLKAPFVQLFDMSTDPGEQRNLAEKHPEVVKRLVELFDRQIQNGRSTEGPSLKNDTGPLRYHARVPAFVFK